MFNLGYLRDLSCRLHLLARDCGDVRTAVELRRTVDEIWARADDAENLLPLFASSQGATGAAVDRQTEQDLVDEFRLCTRWLLDG
jgi:hypothetical protein